MNIYQHPAIYIGDFNSHHDEWGYETNDENGETLMTWATAHELHLVHDAKDRRTFYSRAHRKEYNPDLCFVSTDAEGWPLQVTKKVLAAFPNSQHRPVVVEVGMSVPIITSVQKPRWNFRKADWKSYQAKLDAAIRFIPPEPKNYDRFTNLVISTAKQCVPRGYRKEYIPCWNEDTERLYNEFQENASPETAKEILKSLDDARRSRWIHTVESMDMKRSSRKAWSLVRKLGAAPKLERKQPKMDADRIASRLVKTSRVPANKNFSSRIIAKYRRARKNAHKANEISKSITVADVNEAMNNVKEGKASGFDGIYPEFLTHSGPRTRLWLAKFFTKVLKSNFLPAAFKIAKIISLLKPKKDESKPENYRPIALLSVTLKLLERVLFNRMSPEIEKVIPSEQAGFREGRSCTEQVLSLTNHIESGYQKGLKTGLVLVDLTAAYDTVWKQGLLFKLISVIPCLEICDIICNLLSDRLFQILLNDQKSGLRKLNNGLAQGSVLSCLLFNLYTHDLPPSVSRKFLYADDMSYAYQHKDFNEINKALNSDMALLVQYCKNWRLIPNPSKTVVTCFHLRNRGADLELRIWFDGVGLKHSFDPSYLGIRLDRSLTFEEQSKQLASKLASRNNLLRKLACTSWGATASCLRTTAMGLIYPTAEYCCSSWLNSTHSTKLDNELHKTMRIISGTVNSTPLPWLPALSGIEPPDVRRKSALLRDYRKAVQNNYIPLHYDILQPVSIRLHSRNPPIETARQLDANGLDVYQQWKIAWPESVNPSAIFNINTYSSQSNEFALPRKIWCNLNRLRTGHGRCNYMLHKWKITDDPSCECGEQFQTIQHILQWCQVWSYNGEIDDLMSLTPQAMEWLRKLQL